MSDRATLTPQMLDYDAKFADSGEVRWLPYLMYFHPAEHHSKTVSTDTSGFRYSEANGLRYSAADLKGTDSVRVLAGSSTVFGIGASSDAWTLSSRLTANDPREQPWLNFGGRSFNSTQELMLLMLYRHLLPKVEEIVLFSGFNNLGLARLPASMRGEHGAFFNCNEFFDAFGTDADRAAAAQKNPSMMQRLLGGKNAPAETFQIPSMEEQIAYAGDLTLRHLDLWRVVAEDLGAKLTYVLQPLAGWVREKGCDEEERLFAELDKLGRFSETYGDILQEKVNLQYAALIEQWAQSKGVGFINLSPVLADRLASDQWLFVDRIHFTDDGHDFVAKQLLDLI